MSRLITQSLYEEPSATNTLMIAHIECDTAADLPAPTDFPGITLLLSSTADVVETGEKYKMKSDGTWILQPTQQADTYTTTQIDAMIDGRIPFSMPETIPSTADLDTYTTPGTYNIPSNILHAPVTSRGRIDVIELTDTQIVQQIYRGTGSTTRLYMRNLNTIDPISWHPWVPVDTLGIGIGITLNTADDLNTFVKYGVFVATSTSIASSVLNRPAYSDTHSKIFTVRVDAFRFRVQQTLIAVNISSGTNYGNLEYFYRIGESDQSRWGSWHQMTTTTIQPYTPA